MDKRADPPRARGDAARADAALQRLEQALSRLESGLAAPARNEDRRRVGELEAELAKLNGEHRALAATVDLVTRKLDETIRRLRAAQPNDA